MQETMFKNLYGYDTNFKPILKWAGGKRALVPVIMQYKPSFDRYVELFFGGGAVLFAIQPEKAIINDINVELINVYKIVKYEVDRLIELLKEHKFNSDKEYYYEVRNWDRDKYIYNNLSEVGKAARILYLNKTGFNGLYRVNSKNQFNVPIGGTINPNIVNEEGLRSVSSFLNENNVVILNTDFENVLEYMKKDDFVYLDPPYDALKKQSFVTYSKDGFDKKDQVRLKLFYDKLTKQNCKVILSNSFTDFILDLYKDYDIKIISAYRYIGASSQSRVKVKEVLVLNF